MEPSDELDADFDELFKDDDGAELDLTERIKEADAPVVKMANLILLQAVERRAEEIHLERHAERLVVRQRVDGRLHPHMDLPVKLQNGLMARLKILACLDIAERRRPQSGRFSMQVHGVPREFHLFTLPGRLGESLLIRIVPPAGSLPPLDALDFSPANLARYQRLLASPRGLLVHAGVGDAGHDETMRCALQALAGPERKLISIEHAVFCSVDGVIQMEARPELPMDAALHAALSQRPDVLLLSEIHDLAILDLALKAALHGCLVLAALPVREAPAALARLLDMGAPPYLLAEALVGVCAQRRVRRLCPVCAEPHALSREEMKLLRTDQPVRRARVAAPDTPSPCPACMGLGYRGRLSIQEVLEVTPALRERLRAAASTSDLAQAARAGGWEPCFEDAREKVLDGRTSLDELLCAAPPDNSTE
ncbi:MAG: ATPase, T2SS/T4P/T4SS family [Planctomycetota bacterium]|nr:ATPase, T2SS/T4P/T4SS family [Planctomycetota bacterium]